MIYVENIVRLIVKVRKEKKVSQKRLGLGICSVQEISRLESGAVAADFFLLEVLLQRLGKSLDKLEIVISKEEFAEIRERDELLDILRQGRLQEAEAHIKRFCGAMEKGNTVRRIQSCRMKGIYSLEKGEYAEAEEVLGQAVSLFMSGGASYKDMLMAEVELEALILLAHASEKLGKKEKAAELLEIAGDYLRREVADEEQLAKFLPRLAVVGSSIAEGAGRTETCARICEEALELLRKHGLLQLMTPVLGYLAAFYRKGGRESEAKKLDIWKKTIEGVYGQFGLSVESVNKLYFSSCIGQYYLAGEVIREERLARGLSQEQLIEGIYENPETLSRIENGCRPNRKKLKLLFDKLGIQRQRYSGRVITSSYELLELYSEVAIMFARKEDEKALWGLELLRRKLDMTIPENRQIVECFEIACQYETGQMTNEQALQEIQELLRLTYRMDSGRVPFEGEALLLNQVCSLLGRLGRREEAISLQKRVIGIYERSYLPLKYHFRMAYLIMENMACNLAYMGHEEAKEWNRRAAIEQLINGKGNSIHVLLSNFVGMEMCGQGDKELCEKWIKWAYSLTDIFLQYHDREYLIAYEKKYFDENVEWY